MSKSIKLMVMILVTLISLPCRAYEFLSDGINYNTLSSEDRTVEVVRKKGSPDPNKSYYSGAIEIPTKVIYSSISYTVTTIGKQAFWSSDITSIVLPNLLTAIRENAFSGCTKLTSISLPNSLIDLGKGAFSGCAQLQLITLPNSLTTIGENAFAGCSSLESITLPNSLTALGKYTFARCSSLESITLPNSLTAIKEQTFEDCSSLISITLPNSLTTLGNYAFNNCTGLTSITLSNSLTDIGEYAFNGCTGLTSITLPNSLTTLGNYAFNGCSGLTSITLPYSLRTIAQNTFDGCIAMTHINVETDNAMFSSIDGVLYNKDASMLIKCPEGKLAVSFPSSLLSIEERAFSNCTGLTSITLPNALTTIGESAFKGCTGLASITLPYSLAYIGFGAFSYCNSLKSIKLLCPTPIKCTPSFSDEVLKSAVLYIPKGTSEAYGKVDPWRNFWNIEEVDFAGATELEADNDAPLRISISDGTLTIDGINGSENVTISDMHGRTVYSGTARSIDGLVPGLYIIKTGRHTAKFSI